MDNRKSSAPVIAMAGGAIVVLILVLGTLWMGRSAGTDTERAVRSVSLLYLEELAGRREQVVEDNLTDNINTINVAIGLMTEEDLSDAAHFRAYQSKMRLLFNLEKFAFVDETGLIYTAAGTRTDIDRYRFDYAAIAGPEISIVERDDADRAVVIAVPVDHLPFNGSALVACFMEIGMDAMLRGVSMQSQATGATFCNLYTADGVPLSNKILGGLAEESNLFDALANAAFEAGYSRERVASDFQEGRRGVAAFAYRGTRETLSYVPVSGTDWLLTYLIRESVISNQISAVTDGIIRRSLLQSALTALALAGLFAALIAQNKRAAKIALAKETADAENRVKREALEQRLALQEALLQRKREGDQQARMIAALASNYRSVYYLDLDSGEGMCYQAHADLEAGFKTGERFEWLSAFTDYANRYITDEYRDDFLRFIQPEAIRAGLSEEQVISFRYLARLRGRERYEMIRLAGVRTPEDGGGPAHSVGACLADVDAETRKTLE